MKFTRTDKGLSNSALFFSVDYVVYTEGGERNFSKEEIDEGAYNKSSPDIKFWGVIFKKYGFHKKIKFKALGSKSCLKHICGRLEESQLTNTIVAMDSDLDDFIGSKYQSNFILYTKGYSWENDVYTFDLIKNQIAKHSLIQELEAEDLKAISNLYQLFLRHLSRLLRIELLFRSQGHKFVSGLSGERFVQRGVKPSLNINEIQQLIRQKKQVLSRPVFIANPLPADLDCFSYTYGKLIESFSVSVLTSFLKKLGRGAAPNSFIQTTMIDAYSAEAQNDAYYESMVKSIEP